MPGSRHQFFLCSQTWVPWVVTRRQEGGREEEEEKEEEEEEQGKEGNREK